MSVIYTTNVLIFILFIITVQIKDFKREKSWKKRSLSVLILITCIYILFRVLLYGLKTDFDTPFIAAFTWQHGQYVWMVALTIVYLILYRDRIREQPRPFFKSYFYVSLFQILSLYSWYALETGFDMAIALPLELSRISSLLYLVYLRNTEERIIDVTFYFGIFAIGSFLLPKTINDLDHVLGWSYFINHAITLTIPILAHFAFGWEPKKRKINEAYRYFLFYIVVVIIVNDLVDGNYFFLVDRPFLNHWPFWAYLIFTLAGTYLVFWLGYWFFQGFIRISDRNKG